MFLLLLLYCGIYAVVILCAILTKFLYCKNHLGHDNLRQNGGINLTALSIMMTMIMLDAEVESFIGLELSILKII